VFAGTLAVTTGYVFAIWSTGHYFLIRWMPDIELRYALAFLLVQFALILTLFDASFVTKVMRRAREARSNSLRPDMIETLSAHIAGADHFDEIRRMYRRHPRVLERCLIDLLFQLKGNARSRLTTVAIDLKLTHRWLKHSSSRDWIRRREAIRRLGMIARTGPDPVLKDADRALIRALSDPQPSIRLEAARSLIESGDTGKIGEVFQLAVNGSLLVRAVLTEALRPYAAMLCRETAPAVLQSNDAQRTQAALQILGAWEQSLAIPQIGALVGHADPGVRAAAVQLLAQMEDRPQAEYQVIKMLQDPDGGVRKAAAVAASRLGALGAIPALRGCLRQQSSESVLAAARALAANGADGCKALEDEVTNGAPFSRAAALEALERQRLAPAGSVGISARALSERRQANGWIGN
jgi:HEAT repeat protein